MLNIQPNQVVKIGNITGVVEGRDIYQHKVYNIYCGSQTTRRSFPVNEITEIVDRSYVGQELFAFQVYNQI